jgi:hypothetical protein
VGIDERLEPADLDVVARGGGAVVVAEAEAGAALAAEQARAAHEEAARAHVQAPELLGVAEPRVVDGVEGHHAAAAVPAQDARRRVAVRRAQAQVVPARAAAATRGRTLIVGRDWYGAWHAGTTKYQ